MDSTNGTGKVTEGTEERDASAQGVSRVRARVQAVAPPLGRRRGTNAKDAQLRARFEVARVLGDPAEEDAAALALATRLAARDVELDAAVDVALRALTTSGGPELRHALAGWLEGLGEPGLAASELRKLVNEDDRAGAASLLLRVGVLHARAGDAVGAEDALERAAALDERDPLALELLGAVAAWAPESMSTRAGADAYVRAARRRAALGDAEGEREDLLRAFELDEASPTAAAALVGARASTKGAADQVHRVHAAALVRAGRGAEAADVHGRRRAAALEAGELGVALGAALDEGLDAVLEGEGADAMDDLLLRAGAFEVLAARLEARADRERGRAASRRLAELGRLLAGPLAAPERALEAYARAVAADPTNADALQALRASAAQVGSDAWLVEGLLRAALGGDAWGASDEPIARLTAARALAEVAAERRDGALASWAHSVVASLDPTDERARAEAGRLAEDVRRRDEELGLAEQALQSSAEAARTAVLGDLAALLRSAPGESRRLAAVLVELVAARREDDALLLEALRVLERVSDLDAVARLCRERLAKGAAPPRVRVALVGALRRAGDPAAAGEAARALLDACTPWGYGVAWITAAIGGQADVRAHAIAAVAPTCATGCAATLGAVAAELLAGVGDRAGARRAAELACRADPEDARAARALADVVPLEEARVAAAALQHACDVAGPSSALALRLADALERLGEAAQSLGWARRAVALRPGDPAAAQSFVDRAVRLADARAAAEALAWLLPQPQPAKATAARIAPALRAMAQSDAAGAAALATRALDVLGPRDAALRSAILDTAGAAGDGALRARLLERWMASAAPAAEREPLLRELAGIYAELGDTGRELSAYVRLARMGADLSPARGRVEALEGALADADDELAWLEVRAELSLDEGRSDLASRAFRELGGALWDMADDRPRAVQAWLRAAHCDSARGYATFRRDLTSFAEARYAADCLAELAQREEDRARAGVIATEAARAALEAGDFARAITLSRTALERHPGHAEALETAESACLEIGRVHEMSPIYDQVARRALGRFGRRAAHHRAARFFEAGGVPMLALKHAAQAFIAVPSEGSTLALLERTSDSAQRRSIAVRTVEHVAELSRSPAMRAGWLLRAATLAARDLDGTRQRVDLLLKAAVLSAAPASLAMLTVAARELLAMAPEDGEVLAMRLERASDSLAKDLEGPDGARIAITFAEMALDSFEDAAWAWRDLERAIGADADVDEYVRLVPHARRLAAAAEAAAGLAKAFAEIEKPYANVGHAMLRLVGTVAGAMGDAARRARALVMAAEKESDDDELVVDADAAVLAWGDAALAERFAKKVGVFRRTEALRAVAAKVADRGEAEAAVALLERACAIAPNEQKDAAERELRGMLVRAGRGEEAVLQELGSPELTAGERAERWAALAKLREERGDPSGATDAFLQAAGEEPTAARWAAVERAAERCGREHIRVEALRKLVDLAPPSGTLPIQKRLARAEAARGSLAAAEAAWRAVWAADPGDNEADVAIEALLVARASYDELAEHLERRAARLARDPDARETLRAVRLRRAAILEQRLGRLQDASRELEQVLVESPGHASARRWLADLYERTGDPTRGVALLDELIAESRDRAEREALAIRRTRALVAARDLDRAREAVQALLARAPGSAAVLEVAVEVARASGDPLELGSALAELARVSPDEARARSEMLVEAAQAAARAGDTQASLARAREAAALAPDVASTQLFARGLEYRLRGAGSREDAELTIDALSRIRVEDPDAPLEAEDVALRAFLLAEAQDVLAPGAGEATLRDCLGRVGPQPLVALGLAERAAAGGRFEEAKRFYASAVQGNLLGLRRPGRVAFAAAEAAERTGDDDATAVFLNEAALDPETRTPALLRLGRAAIAARDLGRARGVLRALAEGLERRERAGILAELARALFESQSPADRLEADRTLREAIEVAPEEVAEALRAELETFRARPPTPSAAPAGAAATRSSSRIPVPQIPAPPPVLVAAPPDEPAASLRHPLGAPPPVEEAADAPVATASRYPAERGAARVEAARARLAAGAREEAERMLLDALRDGSAEAADVLDELLSAGRGTSSAVLKIRRQAVELCPGDVQRLARLRDAAKADQNHNYVRALEHVLRAFDPSQGPQPPPPLSAQSPQPGMMGLLSRHSHEPAGEAFGVVWEGASTVFARPPTAYGMTGFERIVPGPTSALSRLYEVALRLLDTPRFALFHRRGAMPLTATVALLSNPAAILAGEAKDDGLELRWMLGQALSAVLPENALPLGLPPSDARALWQVLVGAFGPPGAAPFDRAHALLADTLWQTLAPRAQRRLKELLAGAAETPFELVIERAKQSGRRVGMFLTGDFAHAARTVVSEYEGFDPATLSEPGGLARLCGDLPALADLFRLAVRPEYADARWHVPAPTSQRFSLTGGLPLV